MKTTKPSTFRLEVGVDVAKNELQVDAGQYQRPIPNTHRAISSLLSKLCKDHSSLRITCESTGGYENLLIRVCLEKGVAVSRVNPLHVKHFVRSYGTRAKTDRIDARMLARFGRERNPVCLDGSWLALSRLREHQRHLNRLIRQRTALLGEIDKYLDKALRAEIRREIRSTERKIERSRQIMAEMVEADPELLKRREIMEKVSGVGRATSHSLLATMPELGTMDRRRAASLAGLAPHPRESGLSSSPRFIGAGRKEARTALYMAALAATRHNEHLRGYFRQLRARGKSGKVALIAVARKLLIYLNTQLKPLGSTI